MFYQSPNRYLIVCISAIVLMMIGCSINSNKHECTYEVVIENDEQSPGGIIEKMICSVCGEELTDYFDSITLDSVIDMNSIEKIRVFSVLWAAEKVHKEKDKISYFISTFIIATNYTDNIIQVNYITSKLEETTSSNITVSLINKYGNEFMIHVSPNGYFCFYLGDKCYVPCNFEKMDYELIKCY